MANPFDGLDEAERAILEREIREGNVKLEEPVTVVEFPPPVACVAPRYEGGPDTRDLRDPTVLGNTILDPGARRAAREHMYGKGSRKRVTLSGVYEYLKRRGGVE